MTSFLSVGIMTLFAPLPMDRVHLVNPGDRVTVGDRTLSVRASSTLQTMDVTFRLSNRTHSPLHAVVEPWAHEYDLPGGVCASSSSRDRTPPISN